MAKAWCKNVVVQKSRCLRFVKITGVPEGQGCLVLPGDGFVKLCQYRVPAASPVLVL